MDMLIVMAEYEVEQLTVGKPIQKADVLGPKNEKHNIMVYGQNVWPQNRWSNETIEKKIHELRKSKQNENGKSRNVYA